MRTTFWYGEDMHGWGFWLLSFSAIALWIAVIAVIVGLVRYFSRPGRHPGTESPPQATMRPGTMPPAGPPPAQVTPEQVLAQRYARGEIDDEEYHRRLRTLRAAEGAPESDGHQEQ